MNNNNVRHIDVAASVGLNIYHTLVAFNCVVFDKRTQVNNGVCVRMRPCIVTDLQDPANSIFNETGSLSPCDALFQFVLYAYNLLDVVGTRSKCHLPVPFGLSTYAGYSIPQSLLKYIKCSSIIKIVVYFVQQWVHRHITDDAVLHNALQIAIRGAMFIVSS